MSVASRWLRIFAAGLTVFCALILVSPGIANAAPGDESCSWREVQAGLCGVSDSSVVIEAIDTVLLPPSDFVANTTEGDLDNYESAPSEPVPNPTPPRFTIEEFQRCMDGRNDARTCFRGIQAPAEPAPEGETAASPATPARVITMSDIARFIPTNATMVGEPDNVAVVGLPANFLSSAATETVPGTILGRALTIRFTPVNYAFDYGDGERRDSATPGTPWDAGNMAQFTATDTSHVYTEPGTYTATVTVSYTADIDIGSGWIPIDGTLNGPPASQQIRVVKAYTALVQGTCSERPTAPGC